MARTQGSHSDITGPKVREAALRLFAEHGYAAVSMRQIAAEVGVQAGALYNYTPDKQHLLFSLLHEHMEGLLAAQAAQPVPEDPVARLEAFCRFHIRQNRARPQAVFISYMELRSLTPEHFAEIGRLRDRYEAGLEAVLKAGQATGAFSVEDTRIATFAVIGLLNAVNVWFREDGRLTLEEVERLHWDMVRRAVSA
ncbi:TetR/AcrR family transcriptional regulator [Roseivivax isoporae]|uniref:TetR family transcriptional regulator n=1 Tax=Roseivivax isoporae LMG 25204 TaxID=1449351 RepID=X7F7A7_9RHOB|nr:TetR/AcrR family transcriptional regulator [Roseivivax isoporae]ETX28812.1 TetR family transcriptional regulator [Roseivivax isoporae LMG 25204]